jgi:hypothetical protein
VGRGKEEGHRVRDRSKGEREGVAYSALCEAAGVVGVEYATHAMQ